MQLALWVPAGGFAGLRRHCFLAECLAFNPALILALILVLNLAFNPALNLALNLALNQ
jgi:hypothetical protein